MPATENDPFLHLNTSCGSLLNELEVIWDEVGEMDDERDQTILDLERECLDVYRRKVDQANRSRAQLKQTIADDEAELASICSALGEPPLNVRQSEQKVLSLKEERNAIRSQLEEMQRRKIERKKQFVVVLEQINKVSNDLYGSTKTDEVDEMYLSTRNLEEWQKQLQLLHKEKSDRLNKVLQQLSSLKSLCSVLGFDFKQNLNQVHSSFSGPEEAYSLSTDTILSLETATRKLRELKLERMQMLQDLGTSLLEIWNLMDTPIEEQQAFQHVTCNIAASEEEITDHNMLSLDLIKSVEAELSRLEELKSSKMKELVLKKRSELEDICRKTHLILEGTGEAEIIFEAIESGAINPADLLEEIELDISKVKEEAFNRKDLLDKVEKWLSACEEESWLEEYEMDDNRYGRGAHLTLKRAEKARILVSKLPGIVDGIAMKAKSWEEEQGSEFTYDGVSLLSMLEDYKLSRQEKEEAKRRQREQKKIQGQLIAEQETLFGSKPISTKLLNGKKSSRTPMASGANNKRTSSGVANLHTPRPASAHSARVTSHSRPAKRSVDDDIGVPSNARKSIDNAKMLVKNYTFNGRENETPINQRLFSPISSPTSMLATSTSSKNNITGDPSGMLALLDDENIIEQNYVCIAESCIGDKENVNKEEIEMSMPLQRTSSRQTITTQKQVHGGEVEEDSFDIEETEYSFEERRAGFVLQNSEVKKAVRA